MLCRTRPGLTRDGALKRATTWSPAGTPSTIERATISRVPPGPTPGVKRILPLLAAADPSSRYVEAPSSKNVTFLPTRLPTL